MALRVVVDVEQEAEGLAGELGQIAFTRDRRCAPLGS
jgi:hypothetical protein